MKYIRKEILAIVTAAALTGGCAQSAQQATAGATNTQKGVAVGALAGAALGQLIGKKTNSTLIGAAAGAALGGAIGYSMDKQAAEVAKSLDTEVNTNPNAEATSDSDIIVTKTERYVKITFRDKMMFPTDSDQLTPTARYKIEKLVSVLRNYPQTVIQVVGHTDNRGSYGYNQLLSKKRARTVADMLVQAGIPNPIYEKGCSYAKPVVPNTSLQNMARNRRVEVYLYPSKEMITDPCI